MSEDEDRKAREAWLINSVDREGWDKKPIMLAFELRNFLEHIKDEGTFIDSGTNGVSGDLWVTVGGIEWFIEIKKSNLQLEKEGK